MCLGVQKNRHIEVVLFSRRNSFWMRNKKTGIFLLCTIII